MLPHTLATFDLAKIGCGHIQIEKFSGGIFLTPGKNARQRRCR